MVEEKQVSPETINKERTDRGLTILEAAKEMGISHSTLSRYERNLIKRPYTDSLEKMKEWLNQNKHRNGAYFLEVSKFIGYFFN